MQGALTPGRAGRYNAPIRWPAVRVVTPVTRLTRPVTETAMPPPGFSWVDQPHLAALAHPDTADDLIWLRRNGIDVLISLTEDPAPRTWVNDAGLMLVHVPVPDMEAPTVRQFEVILDTVRRATAAGMGTAIHCAAGKGRTGTVLAAYFVSKGLTAKAAIEKVRALRPGSVETAEQEQAVADFERNRGGGEGGGK